MTPVDSTSNVSYNHRHIRDPLYGFIGISEEENKLIDTPAFLRLRRIKQLSHTYVVYPSAVHTRFEHSLGTMHVAGRMCDALGITGDQKRIVRLSALLHDIGHGPFSHLFEHVLQKRNSGLSEIHEEISSMIIKDDDDISFILGDDVDLINTIIQGSGSKDEPDHILMHSIVSGDLDADKLDYLRRDSYHIGAQYGVFDLERIMHTLKRLPGDHPLTSVSRKGAPALENYRLSRYMMHVQVYEHHTRLAAELMFLNAMDIAIDNEDIFPKNTFNINSSGFLDFYKSLDDDSIYAKIITSDKSKIAKDILLDIQNRRLLKRASHFMLRDLPPGLLHRKLSGQHADSVLRSLHNTIIDKLNPQFPSHMIICHKSDIQIKLYNEGDLLYVHNQEPSFLSDVSPIVSKPKTQWFYVYAPNDPKIRNQVNAIVADELGANPDSISANS